MATTGKGHRNNMQSVQENFGISTRSSIPPVRVKNIFIGPGYPILLQSMTNTDTNDIEASVEQCIRIFDAGAQMVRLTTQGMREVESLGKIKAELHKRGYDLPLVADVHFLPAVAEAAAAVADKIRINPGNYVDRKYEGPLSFDAEEQSRQVEIIKARLRPLIKICRQNDTAVRIGVNHGSLSKRMLSWYGDSPEGMVESAMEFIRIFAEEDFHKIVVSLKASNTKVMVQANRMLYRRMVESGRIYPLHLGVTEAGSDEDGRIKSAVGICTLLADGIGDTIRVSLTEDPECEIPVGRRMIDFFGRKGTIGSERSERREEKEGKEGKECQESELLHESFSPGPTSFEKRKSEAVLNIGGDHLPVVIAGSPETDLDIQLLATLGYHFTKEKTLNISDTAADIIATKEIPEDIPKQKGLKFLNPNYVEENASSSSSATPSAPCSPFSSSSACSPCPSCPPSPLSSSTFIEFSPESTIRKPFAFTNIPLNHSRQNLRHFLKTRKNTILLLHLPSCNSIHETRDFFRFLKEEEFKNPVILCKNYGSAAQEEIMIRAAGELGALFVDGLGDGIWISDNQGMKNPSMLKETAFHILQASGARISKTEYIACPSCGRTLFNIQDTLKKVKEATSGMKGLKIAVMGCIVNGLGEMADADFGYVGAGRGKVSLYKGKELVQKNIPEEGAVEALVGLIHSYSFKRGS